MAAPNISRREWLEMRPSSIGASEAASASGEGRTSTLELYGRKIGAIPEPDLSDEEQIFWGNALEPIIVEETARRRGLVLLHPERNRDEMEKALSSGGATEVIGWVEGRQPFLRSVARPWMTATLDGLARKPEKGRNLYVSIEGKNVGEYLQSKWQDADEEDDEHGDEAQRGQGPDPAIIQVTHQLAVVPGVAIGVLSGLIGGNKLRIVDLPRAGAAIDSLCAIERAFWDLVESRTPPAPDGSESSAYALKLLHPDDNGQTVVLPARFVALSEELAAVKAQRSELKVRFEQIKAEFAAELKANTFGVLPDGSGTFSLKTTERVGHTVAPCKFRTLRYAATKASKSRK